MVSLNEMMQDRVRERETAYITCIVWLVSHKHGSQTIYKHLLFAKKRQQTQKQQKKRQSMCK